uniref:Uncharacterized protein n=1 Tax=Rhizophora mucronata TaxID=61149 RepID=A0A2P2LWC5_RHIMU
MQNSTKPSVITKEPKDSTTSCTGGDHTKRNTKLSSSHPSP